MKKVFAMLLALTMTLSLAACGCEKGYHEVCRYYHRRSGTG